MKKSDALLFALLMGLFVPLELVCALLAYETYGEITSRLLIFLVLGINLAFVIVGVRRVKIAALGAVLLAVIFVSNQAVLGYRLIRVQVEAASIVAYVYEYQMENSHYPSDLSAYDYQDETMAQYIQRYRLDESTGGFMLLYWVGTENTSHFYSPQSGWRYYPD